MRNPRGEKVICGVGVNDADYVVITYETSPKMNGKRSRRIVWECPFYVRWKSMIRRCYSNNKEFKDRTYKDCIVCDEWHLFSNFKSWMEQQDWEGKHLDKDILIHGNKVYAPDLCVFVDQKVNNFLTERKMTSNPYPTGVVFLNHLNKFKAACHNVKTKQQKHIGLFETAEEAHLAWLFYKLEQAKSLASEQTDQRVAVALISRYENYLKEKEVE